MTPSLRNKEENERDKKCKDGGGGGVAPSEKNLLRKIRGEQQVSDW